MQWVLHWSCAELAIIPTGVNTWCQYIVLYIHAGAAGQHVAKTACMVGKVSVGLLTGLL